MLFEKYNANRIQDYNKVKDSLIVVGKAYPVKYGEIVKIKEVIKYF